MDQHWLDPLRAYVAWQTETPKDGVSTIKEPGLAGAAAPVVAPKVRKPRTARTTPARSGPTTNATLSISYPREDSRNVQVTARFSVERDDIDRWLHACMGPDTTISFDEY